MSTTDYYEAYWSPTGFRPQADLEPQVRRLLETHVADPTARCLDVGCGNGISYGRWLKDHVGEYVGVDISETAVAEARGLGLGVHRIRDASDLPFPDGSFASAVCLAVLEHLFQPQLVAAEIVRALRPGGVLVVTVPNVAYWRRRADLLLFGRWNPVGDDLSSDQPWRDPHIRFFTTRTLRRMLTRAGFERVDVGGHDGALIRDTTVLRRLAGSTPSRPYRVAQRLAPGFFGHRLHGVARRAATEPPPLAPRRSSGASGTTWAPRAVSFSWVDR